ncbi:Vacuolar amino acid transporter 6 [Diplonema papillatum]|nr:Vacuolar amino acid transporter 6 [Diplonema papillatum]
MGWGWERETAAPDSCTGLVPSIVSIVKSTVGVGLVAMPFTCAHVGYLNFLILLIIFGALSHFANVCLAHATEMLISVRHLPTEKVPHVDYVTLSVMTFGKRAQWPVFALCITVCWGGAVAVMIALLDVLHGYLAGSMLASPSVFLPIVAVLVFPMCCADSLESLWYASYLGIAGCLALTMVLAELAWTSKWSMSELAPFDFAFDRLTLVPVVVFCYFGHYNFISIYCGSERRSVRRITRASVIAHAVAFTLYAATGVLGYLAFNGATSQDVLKNLRTASGYMRPTAELLYAMMLYVTIPVCLFEARAMLEESLQHFCPTFLAVEPDDLDSVDETLPLLRLAVELRKKREKMWSPLAFATPAVLAVPRPLLRRMLVVAGLLTSATYIAVTYPHVITLLGLLGASTSTTTMVILPPAFLLQISVHANVELSSAMKTACWAFLTFGLLAVPLFTGLSIATM